VDAGWENLREMLDTGEESMNEQLEAVLQKLYNEYGRRKQSKSKTPVDVIRWTEARNVLIRVAEAFDIELEEEHE
jgi:hypothetical protein